MRRVRSHLRRNRRRANWGQAKASSAPRLHQWFVKTKHCIPSECATRLEGGAKASAENRQERNNTPKGSESTPSARLAFIAAAKSEQSCDLRATNIQRQRLDSFCAAGIYRSSKVGVVAIPMARAECSQHCMSGNAIRVRSCVKRRGQQNSLRARRITLLSYRSAFA